MTKRSIIKIKCIIWRNYDRYYVLKHKVLNFPTSLWYSLGIFPLKHDKQIKIKVVKRWWYTDGSWQGDDSLVLLCSIIALEHLPLSSPIYGCQSSSSLAIQLCTVRCLTTFFLICLSCFTEKYLTSTVDLWGNSKRYASVLIDFVIWYILSW